MSTESKPLHVGIILDGNRRWAAARGLHPWKGHEAGTEKAKDLFKWLEDTNVKEATLYIFSMQNFLRADEEKEKLFDIFRSYFRELQNDKTIYEKKIRVKAIGRLHLFPDDIQEIVANFVNKTKDHDRYTVNFAMGYGGREEIVDACRRIADKIEKGALSSKDINEEMITKHLYLEEEPDFIIRTSGEKRTSNFLPWQSSYSEWFFLDKAWPEFTKADLVKCIIDFKKRSRRFGK